MNLLPTYFLLGHGIEAALKSVLRRTVVAWRC